MYKCYSCTEYLSWLKIIIKYHSKNTLKYISLSVYHEIDVFHICNIFFLILIIIQLFDKYYRIYDNKRKWSNQ
jgi:hypothetical protein